MYTRFFRWASDRIRDDGIIAFITNRNFIEKNAFDGFRKIVARDFEEIWVMDLGGDVRANPKISGTKHNVFGIQTGVAISFFIKRKDKGNAVIHYARRPEMETREQKLSFIAGNTLGNISFNAVQPDRKHNWINLTTINDWEGLLPIADARTKVSKFTSQDRAIFRLFSRGVATQRDEWVYDLDREHLIEKAKYLVATYEHARKKSATSNRAPIKWDRELERYREKGIKKRFEEQSIERALYRPYCCRWLYFDTHFNGMTYQLPVMFPHGKSNTVISFSDGGHRADFCVLSANVPVDLHFGAAVDAYQLVSRYRYSDRGERFDNVTDWAQQKFETRYESSVKAKKVITKDAIFHYVYGVLHDPIYREKYALNLKREFPHIPFYADFWRWAERGEALMALHIGYEAIESWPLKRIDAPDEKSRKAGLVPRTVLRADKDTGNIQLDSETQLTGVPPEVWTYRLGNRSAVEWILDQYKEKTPKDPTIREKFNTYRFADHKEKVIDLLKRVTRVSVETMKIVEAMRSEKR